MLQYRIKALPCVCVPICLTQTRIVVPRLKNSVYWVDDVYEIPVPANQVSSTLWITDYSHVDFCVHLYHVSKSLERWSSLIERLLLSNQVLPPCCTSNSNNKARVLISCNHIWAYLYLDESAAQNHGEA
jgi:hypothetical protein